jgi:cytochrome c peroxidase
MPNKRLYGLGLSLLSLITSIFFLFFHLFIMPSTNIPGPISILESKIIDEPLQPIPLLPALDEHKVALGKQLFYESRLSRDNSVSCAHCHDLSRGGVDQLPHAIGIGGASGDVNTPTVFNSALNFVQFWDGRAATLEAQIDGPLHAPGEMDSNWPEVIAKLSQDATYVSAFTYLYAQGISDATIKDALATFERSLVTPNARFDQFLRGDVRALTSEEKAGYALFKDYGCVSCHQGVNIGGNMFQKFGIMADYFADRGGETPADLGRFNVTKNDSDRHNFKVPSLRNVALTAPYFHDGSAQTLEAAVRVMAKYQLGRAIPPHDVALIVRFLHTLTGTYDGEAL